MAATTCEIVSLCLLLVDPGVTLHHPTSIYCDNQSVIQIARNSVFHERTKHIDIECHVIRHRLQFVTIALSYLLSSFQIVDFFTKTHSTSHFRFLTDKLSMFIDIAS